MGLVSLLPMLALGLAWIFGTPVAPQSIPMDPAFELVGTGQSLLVAVFVVAGVRLVRGPRRR